MKYLPRHIDSRLKRLTGVHAACLIEGIRGVGKTSTAQRVVETTLRLDDPLIAEQVARDAEAALGSLQSPVLIDEWQRVPSVWDAVRRAVDEDSAPGRFILSGSARTAVSAAVHAGAGRVLPMRLRPMTLSERSGRAPVVALGDLAEGGIEVVRGARPPFTPSEQLAPTVRSGLPGYLVMEEVDHQEALRSYLDLAVSRDLAEIAPAARHARKLRRYLRAYAAVVATTSDHATIQQAADVAKATAETYHDLLDRLGLIEELPGWSNNRLKRLTKRPKRHLVDPALAAAEHYETAQTLERRGGRLGELFESVVVCQIRAVAEALGLGWRFGHLRSAGGDHEIDLIADLPDGSVVAFEAKASVAVTLTDARHLAALRNRLGEGFRAGLVVHPGMVAFRLDDRIAAVPLGVLT